MYIQINVIWDWNPFWFTEADQLRKIKTFYQETISTYKHMEYSAKSVMPKPGKLYIKF